MTSTQTTNPAHSTVDGNTVDLVIGGMTCASCAARVEKKLNRMDGVSATVNYSTEKARVSYPSVVRVEDLVATVEATGYTAVAPPPPSTEPVPSGDGDGPAPVARSTRRQHCGCGSS